MKKNFLALGICTFALALGLAACDDSTSANGSSGDENPAEVSSSSILTTSSPTENPGSSSSNVIASEAKQSSSSVIVSSSSATTEDPGSSSSSVIPGTDPGSSSSVASSSSSSSSVIQSSSSEGISIKDGSKYDASANTLTDLRDNQVYKTVTIGTQTWMAENLNYRYVGVKYAEGTSYGSDSISWCYDNLASNCDKYGRLYTWSAVMDSAAQFSVNAGTECGYDKICTINSPHRGICPEGWHVPSHFEFEQLINFIDPDFGYNHTDNASSSKAGLYLKSQSGWNSSGNGSDTYGFSALPGGGRLNNGDFDYVGNFAYFWSSGEDSGDGAFGLGLLYDDGGAYLHWDYEDDARSVRCLKD